MINALISGLNYSDEAWNMIYNKKAALVIVGLTKTLN